jgi:hypothetical protein
MLEQFMTREEIIESLKGSDLSRISFQRIIETIKSLGMIPTTEIDIKEGTIIERGRINTSDGPFRSESDISVREDFYNIQTYGRANPPFVPVFYGSIKSDEIPQPRMTILAELSEEFKRGKNFKILYTVGQWRVKKNFIAYCYLYSEKFRTSSAISKIIDDWSKHLDESSVPDKEDVRLVGEFISEEFTKKEIKNHHDYKISAAIAELKFRNTNIAAILYPSVRTDYLGTNIAIKGNLVEEHLELKQVALCEAYSANGQGSLDIVAIAQELGPLNSEFKWVKVSK